MISISLSVKCFTQNYKDSSVCLGFFIPISLRYYLLVSMYFCGFPVEFYMICGVFFVHGNRKKGKRENFIFINGFSSGRQFSRNATKCNCLFFIHSGVYLHTHRKIYMTQFSIQCEFLCVVFLYSGQDIYLCQQTKHFNTLFLEKKVFVSRTKSSIKLKSYFCLLYFMSTITIPYL